MAESRYHRRKKRKTRKWVKRTLWVVSLLFAVILAYGGYVFYQAYDAASTSYNDLGRKGGKSELRDQAVTIGKDPVSILLIGVEDYSSGGKNGRADTQIVVTLNPDTNKMTMTSVPRDTRVYMDRVPQQVGWHKINAAYTYGSMYDYGPNKLTVQTVEDLLNIPIDEYVTVNFSGFRDIVDALNGVTIDVKKPFWEKNYFNNDKRIYFEQGKQRMNGEEALAFVRMRKRAVNNVYSRDERQRQFIKATVKEAISAGTIFKVGEISDILGKNVDTSLSPSQAYALEKAYSSMDSKLIKTIKIDGQNEMIDGLSYFVPDETGLDETSHKLRKALGLPEDSASTNDGSSQSSNGTSESGAANHQD